MSDEVAISAAKAHQAIMDAMGTFKEAGRVEERERILTIMDGWTYDDFASWNDLIRRIKGENK